MLSLIHIFTEISALCKKHDMWFHIDGAYGASVLLSPKYKSLLTGTGLADRDVYKRQILFCRITFLLFLCDSTDSFQILCSKEPLRSHIPVSYTHLDVYKRQGKSKRREIQHGKSGELLCKKTTGWYIFLWYFQSESTGESGWIRNDKTYYLSLIHI